MDASFTVPSNFEKHNNIAERRATPEFIEGEAVVPFRRAYRQNYLTKKACRHLSTLFEIIVYLGARTCVGSHHCARDSDHSWIPKLQREWVPCPIQGSSGTSVGSKCKCNNVSYDMTSTCT